MTGLFLTFEGPDTVGKSKQAKRLVEFLQSQGVDAIYTREPGGSREAEILRSIILSGDLEWSAREEALLFAAARAHHVRTKIIPHLAKGGWVICDRFVDSTLAYQALAGDLERADLLRMHDFATEGLMPDITLMITISGEERRVRAVARNEGLDRMEAKGEAFQQQVQAGFELLASTYPDRIKIIDGHGDIDIVARRILLAIEAHVTGRDLSQKAA